MKKLDVELLKEMMDKGFTLKEISDYFNRPSISIQYYARTRKLGRFKEYRFGKYDKDIIESIDNTKLTQMQIANKLNIPQSFVCKRYKQLKKWEQLKKERFEWLQSIQFVKDVEED